MRATQLELAVAVTRLAAKGPEPRGADTELDLQRGEASRQVRLPQSFTLFAVVKTSSMKPST